MTSRIYPRHAECVVKELRRSVILQQSALASPRININNGDMTRLQEIHWDLSAKCGFERELNWYDHKPNPVCESERFKLLWDFKIETDRHIDHNKPDIVLLNKEIKSCLIIDVACPFDTRIDSKEREINENYHDLKHEMKRIWNCRSVLIGHSCSHWCIGYSLGRIWQMVKSAGDALQYGALTACVFAGDRQNY